MNLSTVKWAQWDKTQLGLFICVCIALCRIIAHNIAQNRPDNFPSYPPDNQITIALMTSIWGKGRAHKLDAHPFLPPNQQCQGTEGNTKNHIQKNKNSIVMVINKQETETMYSSPEGCSVPPCDRDGESFPGQSRGESLDTLRHTTWQWVKRQAAVC